MSQLYVDNIKNRTGGAINAPSGIVVSGVGTFSGDVSIGGTLTSVGIITAQSGIKVTGGEILVGSGFSVGQAGVVTAASFSGDGSGLSGISAGLAASTVTLQVWLFGGG